MRFNCLLFGWGERTLTGKSRGKQWGVSCLRVINPIPGFKEPRGKPPFGGPLQEDTPNRHRLPRNALLEQTHTLGRFRKYVQGLPYQRH